MRIGKDQDIRGSGQIAGGWEPAPYDIEMEQDGGKVLVNKINLGFRALNGSAKTQEGVADSFPTSVLAVLPVVSDSGGKVMLGFFGLGSCGGIVGVRSSGSMAIVVFFQNFSRSARSCRRRRRSRCR